MCLPEVQNSGSSPYICSAAYYYFSQNDTYTENIFKGNVNPVLEGVRTAACSLRSRDL